MTSAQLKVLMYHRVDVKGTDPWGICVSPEHFKKQIEFLVNNYKVFTAGEVIRKIRSEEAIEAGVCISFDDGYADNYIHALPILKKLSCPATFFIATAFIGTQDGYWWDKLEQIFLRPERLPSVLTLSVEGRSYTYTLRKAPLTGEQANRQLAWRWSEPPPTDRCAVFLQIWELLRPLSFQEIQRQMMIIEQWSGGVALNEVRLPLTLQQLQRLAANDLCTIGLHTHTHADLAAADLHAAVGEIGACRDFLREHFRINSDLLAYPYGRFNEATISAVKETQLSACFTTHAVPVETGADIHQLGRYQVGDWNIAHFRNYLDL